VSSALESGRTLGRYRILDFLGAGAMGEVYLAEDPQIERRLAIKTVRLAGRPEEVEERKRRLLREARAAGRLLHPNVVTLFDAGEDQGVLFLAFEYVEGIDLAVRLARQPALSLREVLRVVRQTAEALDYAHRLGIVHRDIKPSNILLDLAGRVKVADFGIAKVAGQSTELTMAGSVMGSPQYLSPEQIRGEEIDGRSDIFSLGVLLYEVLSRKRPFEGDTITTLVYQILHKEPPPVSELRRIPERLDLLLRRMLAKNRDERFATAAELAAEVAAIEVELADETLSAPAADLPILEATRALPRSPSGSSSAPRTVMPPPLPPGALPPPPTASTLGGPPPLPPLPSLPPPSQTTARTPVSMPREGAGPALILGIAAVLFLLVVAAAAWFLVFREKEPETAVAQDTQDAPAMATEPVPGVVDDADDGADAEPAEEDPAPERETELQAEFQPPQSSRSQPAEETEPESEEEEPVRARPEPRVQEPPVRTVPGNSGRNPVVPPPVDAAPAPSAPEPTVTEREPEPVRPSFAADRVVQSGLALEFRVNPPDARVLVDGTVIGTAVEWSGGRKNRTYTLPGPGEYEVKIRAQGLRETRLLVQAGERGGVTPIIARLSPLGGATADASDLRVVRVREAVAFRVTPLVAGILVDGQPAGSAREFIGRPMQPRTWLKLPPGRHRVSVVAPGHQRQDILVEVTPGAEQERDRIDVTLSPGGEE
jgi:serine/threonine protein kinase